MEIKYCANMCIVMNVIKYHIFPTVPAKLRTSTFQKIFFFPKNKIKQYFISNVSIDKLRPNMFNHL